MQMILKMILLHITVGRMKNSCEVDKMEELEIINVSDSDASIYFRVIYIEFIDAFEELKDK